MDVAPVKINEMLKIDNSDRPRRDTTYFDTPYNRLSNSDHSLSYIGPRLYNKCVHNINHTLPDNVPQLQNRFMNSFKANVTKHLLRLQKLGNDDTTWELENFILYTN